MNLFIYRKRITMMKSTANSEQFLSINLRHWYILLMSISTIDKDHRKRTRIETTLSTSVKVYQRGKWSFYSSIDISLANILLSKVEKKNNKRITMCTTKVLFGSSYCEN